MPAPISYFFWRVHSWPRRVVVSIAVIALLLLAGRVALAFVAKRLLNDRLQRIPGYTGHIDDIGSYQL
jgi:hypothetical protein